jgi:hypothetical protein
MDTERLRNLAASYRSRANVTDIGSVRNYYSEMESYLESVVAWIEARRGLEEPASNNRNPLESANPR